MGTSTSSFAITSRFTVPVGLEVSLLALLAVTVAVKVTDWPEFDGVPEVARTVVVESVYWAVPV